MPRYLTPLLSCLAALALTTVVPCASSAAATTEPVVVRDVPFGASGNPALALDVWSSGQSADSRPVLLLLHGGGWQRGRRSQWERHDWTAPFARAGFVVVAASYRLGCRADELAATGAPLEDDPDPSLCGASMATARADVVDALRWIDRSIARSGGDRRRVFVMGASAGGQLALLAATDPAAPQVAGVVAISPPTDLAAIGREDQRLEGAVQRVIGCGWAECPALWERHSPVAALRRSRRVVPTYLFASRRDPRVSRRDVEGLTALLRERRTPTAMREPGAATSGCHGPWSCERFRVAGTRGTLRADVLRWLLAQSR